MNQEEQLFKMRHSCAHMVAAAVQKLYPGAKFGVGPVIENGFYYDIETPEPIGEDDLKKIQKQARKMIAGSVEFKRTEMPIDEAISFFEEKGQDYKVSLLKDLKEKGTTKMSGDELQDVGDSVETVSLYTSGEFVDLCRGPHVENTKEIGAFVLNKLAGAYWRGNENNPQLQRIYGLCFSTKEELDAHLRLLEEAKKRDHRKLGKELDLFVFSELIGSGLPLFTPKGTLLREQLNDYSQQLRTDKGFEKVWVPHITKKELYETSGHWEKFGDELFLVKSQETSDEMVMKPMNCPHHQQIFAAKMRSYKDLPLKYMETTTIYRDEKAGELLGLSRVRSITQDDSHVFCMPEQIEKVYDELIEIVKTFYKTIGMDLKARISLRDPNTPEKYIGDPKLWDKAQGILLDIAKKHGLDYFEAEGEAAFYGPKIDFMATDALGRQWQVATPQLDFVQPQRFGLSYIDADGQEKVPVMIHFALMGSIERFLSVFIEHTAGKFPVWLSPVQVHFVPVSEKHLDGTMLLAKEFEDAGIRVDIDKADETVGKKVRKAVKAKVPYVVVIGDNELNGEPWKIRLRGQEEQETFGKDLFLQKVKQEILDRS